LISKVLYQSGTDDWATPLELFEQLDAEFGFELDVCASSRNAKCRDYYSKEQDGLKQEWHGTCWMNPPYGREIDKWMKKAYEANTTVVCLVPARTCTRWWHEYAMRGEIRLLKGRLKFGGSKNSAPFPSAIVIFRPRGTTFQFDPLPDWSMYISTRETAEYGRPIWNFHFHPGELQHNQ
jgi:phage N-6-adenine-methyltransferase